jgi:hypothetical protein
LTGASREVHTDTHLSHVPWCQNLQPPYRTAAHVSRDATWGSRHPWPRSNRSRRCAGPARVYAPPPGRGALPCVIKAKYVEKKSRGWAGCPVSRCCYPTLQPTDRTFNLAACSFRSKKKNSLDRLTVPLRPVLLLNCLVSSQHASDRTTNEARKRDTPRLTSYMVVGTASAATVPKRRTKIHRRKKRAPSLLRCTAVSTRSGRYMA